MDCIPVDQDDRMLDEQTVLNDYPGNIRKILIKIENVILSFIWYIYFIHSFIIFMVQLVWYRFLASSGFPNVFPQKNVSQFGPAFWPATANKYVYMIYIYESKELYYKKADLVLAYINSFKNRISR